jgi:hypothetical protein
MKTLKTVIILFEFAVLVGGAVQVYLFGWPPTGRHFVRMTVGAINSAVLLFLISAVLAGLFYLFVRHRPSGSNWARGLECWI